MKIKFVPLALSVGILAALWTYVSIKEGWPTWAGFVGWAFLFVAGSDAKAMIKAGVPTLVGVLLGYVALYGLKPGEPGGELGIVGISVAVFLCAAVLVLLMNWGPFALAPAAFGGFAVFFAFTFGMFKSENFYAFDNILYSLLGLFIGIVLGYLSAAIPAWIEKAFKPQPQYGAGPAGEPRDPA